MNLLTDFIKVGYTRGHRLNLFAHLDNLSHRKQKNANPPKWPNPFSGMKVESEMLGWGEEPPVSTNEHTYHVQMLGYGI